MSEILTADGTGRGRPFGTLLAAAFVFAAVLAIVHPTVSRRVDLFSYRNGKFRTLDFPYHVVLTKALWFDGQEQIYTYPAHRRVISDYLERDFPWAMPIGVFPIAFIVWFPFALVARASLPWANSLWVAFSCGVLAFGLLRTARRIRLAGAAFPLTFFVLMYACCISPLGRATVLLGQTSFVAIGALLTLAVEIPEAAREDRHPRVPTVLACVFLCGLKPPYLLLAGGMLFAHRRYRECAYAAGFSLFLLAALTPVLGPSWITDYRDMLEMYRTENFPREYAWSVVPQMQVTFRKAFGGMFGVENARAAAAFVLYAGTFLLALGALLKTKIPLLRNASPWHFFLCFVALYLLFAPYVGPHEDMLIVVAFSIVAGSGACPRLDRPDVLLAVFATIALTVQKSLTCEAWVLPLWLAKAFALGWAILSVRREGHSGRKC